MRRVPLMLLTLTTLFIGACTSWVGAPDSSELVKRPAPVLADVTVTTVHTTTTLDDEYLFEVLEARVTDSTQPAPTTTTEAPAPATPAASTGGQSKPQSTTTTAAPKPAGGFSSQAEGGFQSAINNHRAGQGLAALGRNANLDAYARSWAKKLAANGKLSHSNIGSLLGPWSTAGENVAFGRSVDQIFGALVASAGHNANMVSGAFTALGVGVYVDGSGVLWTVHVFAG